MGGHSKERVVTRWRGPVVLICWERYSHKCAGLYPKQVFSSLWGIMRNFQNSSHIPATSISNCNLLIFRLFLNHGQCLSS